MPPRRTLFRKYAFTFAGLVTAALVVSGGLGLYFSYRDARALVDELQREKARSAALRIEQFARLIEGQLRGTLLVNQAGLAQAPEELHLELIRLLRQAPPIVDVAWIDASGRERVRASRITRDEIDSGRDLAAHPAVVGARTGTLFVSPVYFRHESEPYVTLAVAATDRARSTSSRSGSAGGNSTGAGVDSSNAAVLLAEVNLKFVWEVVSEIKIGTAGSAYVVDADGRLIAHPDIGLVLRRTDLSNLPQVQSELAVRTATAKDTIVARFSSDGRPRWTLNAGAPIAALEWHVLVEQPLTEVFAPLVSAALRTGIVLLAGIALAALIAMALARRMSAPIRALKEGAGRIGEGHLTERVALTTRDELQDLAEQFNQMADRLKASYDELEGKVDLRTRELAAANQAKSRFLAAASHDLRQPAHALGLFVAQFRDAQTRTERDRLLTRIESSSQAVSELLEALFDISKLDAGKLVPQRSVFNVQRIFDRLEQHYAPLAQQRELRFRIRPCALRIETDPLLLEQILMNLTANAMRYTKDGGVLIAGRRRGSSLRIEIWDTGIGIDRADRDHIFEEFFQADGAIGTDQTKGLGLGLAIVKRLVELLSLELEVRSIVGHGSVFAIEAPLAASQQAIIDTSALAAAYPGAWLTRATALVIDDHRDARDAVAGLLSQWGCRVLVAASGAEAQTKLRESPSAVELIVCDFRLAGGELGTDAIAQLRHARGAVVPALIVSGDATDAMRAVNNDPTIHVLAKPLEAAKLRAVLHHLLVATDAPTM